MTLIIKVSLREQPLREPVDELNFNTAFMNTGARLLIQCPLLSSNNLIKSLFSVNSARFNQTSMLKVALWCSGLCGRLTSERSPV